MTLERPARRRFIHISAVFGGAAVLTGLGGLQRCIAAYPSMKTHTWTGIALGADASLQISHPDAAAADTLIERCIAEVDRLEGLFSLYRDDSALTILNRQGFLNEPASDFLTLLGRSKEFSRLTNGMFDVTVQPLWQAYANHFTALGNDAQVRRPDERNDWPAKDTALAMPSSVQHEIREALKLVDWRKLNIEPQQIRLQQANMAITLNGIAQGYITDRIVQLLAANGVDHALINMGEIYGLNPDPASTPWHVGIENAQQPGSAGKRIPIHNQAIATSGAYGTPFTPDLRHNHLLDPRLGTSSHRYHSVTVVAQDATTADALSTAFSLMPEADIKILTRELDIKTYIHALDDSEIREVQI